MSLKMKTISYRGGVVCFDIPSDWREEYEPEGGGTFYDDRPDSGTLRLNVLSFESNNGEPSEQGTQRAFLGSNAELLQCGLPLRRRTVEGKEGGTAIHLHRWEVAVPVPPTGLRIICFAHTILAGQESDPAIAAELELIDRSVRNAEFSREPGVSGDFRQS